MSLYYNQFFFSLSQIRSLPLNRCDPAHPAPAAVGGARFVFRVCTGGGVDSSGGGV